MYYNLYILFLYSSAYQRFGERMNMQSDKELNDLLDFSAVSS